ncbi:MAG: HAD family hydrolase [Bryobacteraceae bacterium]
MKISRRQSLQHLVAAAAIPSTGFGAGTSAPPPIRLVILDIGGTIIADRGNVPELLRRSLSHHGVASTPEEISHWRGASKREIIHHFVGKQSLPAHADREKLTTVIYDEFTADLIEVYRSVPPIAGAGEAIRELRAKGFLVATNTGFDRAVTASIFNRLGCQ